MGAVTAVIVATLLTLGVLNRPYSRDFGGLQPTAMQRTLGTLENARDALNLTVTPSGAMAAGEPA